jgi:hypothetical protein
MIRLLIGLALGYAAYRIVQETVSSIPDEFEPIPGPPRKPQPSAMEDADRRNPGARSSSRSQQR